MKRMISKIALAFVIMSSMPVHASLAQTWLKGARIILQSVGNNPGRLAAVVGGLAAIISLKNSHAVWRACNERIAKVKDMPQTECDECIWHRNNERDHAHRMIDFAWFSIPMSLWADTSLAVGLSYGLAKACGYFGSKI